MAPAQAAARLQIEGHPSGKFLKSKRAADTAAHARAEGLDGTGKTKTQSLAVGASPVPHAGLLHAQIPSKDETTQHRAIWRGTGNAGNAESAQGVNDIPIKKAPDYSEIRAESKREEGGGRCELRPEPAEVDRFAVKGQGKKRGGVNLSQGCREAMDGRRDPRNQSEKRAGSAQLRRAGRLGQPPTLAHSGGGSTANVSQPQIGPSSPKQKY